MKRYNKKEDIVKNPWSPINSNNINENVNKFCTIFSDDIIKYFDFKDHIYGRYIVMGNVVWFNETSDDIISSYVMLVDERNELELEYEKMIRREKLERVVKK